MSRHTTRPASSSVFRTLDAAFAAHPERFARGRPRPLALSREVCINRPAALVLNREEAPVLPAAAAAATVAHGATLNSSP